MVNCSRRTKDENARNITSFSLFDQVAFIGISNWALDPAKMNRGILVQREVPDEEELVQTARFFFFFFFFFIQNPQLDYMKPFFSTEHSSSVTKQKQILYVFVQVLGA